MKDWIGNKTSVMSVLGARNYAKEEREVNDFYATDPNALEVFLKALERDNIKLHSNIWECACEECYLSKVFEAHGYNVKSTDLIYRDGGMSETFDFLAESKPNSWNGSIITNPPYKYAYEFVEKALDTVTEDNKVAMFLKLQFLEGKKRRKLFDTNPPQTIYVSSSRLLCAKNGEFAKMRAGGGSAVAYAWYVWQKGHKGDTIVKWIN